MKYWILLLILCLSLCLFAGCSSHHNPPTETITQAPTEALTEAPTETPTEAPTQAPTEPGVLPMELVGTWEFIYTEIEGEIVEDGSATVTIYGEDENNLYITFRDHLFPDEDFQDKALILDMREMYTDCGNDQWVMDVDYVGAIGNTQYTITLLADGTLVKQNQFTVDDMPMVSYQFFRKS